MSTNIDREKPFTTAGVSFPLRKFLFLCVPVLVVILAITFAIADMRINAELDRIISKEQSHIRQLSGYVTADLSTALIHLRTLTQEAVIRNVKDPLSRHALDELQSEFLTIATLNPMYEQIRWIDETGMERIRVIRERQRVTAMDSQGLRDVSDSYYFKAARSLLAGEVYISHLDLGVEEGTGGMPVRAVLRVATTELGSKGSNRGMLIINVTMHYMIEALRSASDATRDTDYALINQDGYWLQASGQEDESVFQRDLDDKFSRDHPTAWAQISITKKGAAELEDGFWIWENLSPDDAVRRVVLAESSSGVDMPVINSSDFAVIIVAHKPPRVLTELRRGVYITMLSGAILLMLIYVWGLLFLLRSQMREKQASLDIAYAKAREFQMERLKELEERFHQLVEASSVGMVVVDEAGSILMSNSAAESMLGYGQGGLQGLSVDSLLAPNLREQHARMRAEYLRNPEVRKMGVGC